MRAGRDLRPDCLARPRAFSRDKSFLRRTEPNGARGVCAWGLSMTVARSKKTEPKNVAAPTRRPSRPSGGRSRLTMRTSFMRRCRRGSRSCWLVSRTQIDFPSRKGAAMPSASFKNELLAEIQEFARVRRFLCPARFRSPTILSRNRFCAHGAIRRSFSLGPVSGRGSSPSCATSTTRIIASAPARSRTATAFMRGDSRPRRS